MGDLLTLLSLEHFVVVALFFSHVLFAKLSAVPWNFWCVVLFWAFFIPCFAVCQNHHNWFLVVFIFFLFLNPSLLIVNMSNNVEFCSLSENQRASWRRGRYIVRDKRMVTLYRGQEREWDREKVITEVRWVKK